MYSMRFSSLLVKMRLKRNGDKLTNQEWRRTQMVQLFVQLELLTHKSYRKDFASRVVLKCRDHSSTLVTLGREILCAAD